MFGCRNRDNLYISYFKNSLSIVYTLDKLYMPALTKNYIHCIYPRIDMG